MAALLYGVVGVLLSAFIRNPTLDVGNPYLLAPIAAAVLGGTAISGGIGSMLAVTGAALFLVLLGQTLKVLGLETSWQMIFRVWPLRWGCSCRSSRFSPPPLKRNRAPAGPTPILSESHHLAAARRRHDGLKERRRLDHLRDVIG